MLKQPKYSLSWRAAAFKKFSFPMHLGRGRSSVFVLTFGGKSNSQRVYFSLSGCGIPQSLLQKKGIHYPEIDQTNIQRLRYTQLTRRERIDEI